MHTKAHCEVCHGCGKYLVKDTTFVPYSSFYAAMVGYDEVECSACDGTGLNGEEGCFICSESFEPGDNLRIVRGHLIHEGCVDEPWPADAEPPVIEREL